MLACARLGVMHSVVFGGFSGAACGDRIADSGSRVLVTMDGYYRNGNLIDHKVKADDAVATAAKLGQTVDKVLVWRRHAGGYASQTPWSTGGIISSMRSCRDFAACAWRRCPMPADAPLFLMYTSGTTGRPKGLPTQHRRLSRLCDRHLEVLPGHPPDRHLLVHAADIGWITGHSYIVYGPLSLGATSVMYEGVPTYPDAGRLWRIAERLDVNIFHTAPTTIRMLRKLGPDEPPNMATTSST